MRRFSGACRRGLLLFNDCFGRTNGCAGAATGAGILIDFVFAVAFLDGGNGALLGAGAAGNTIIGYFVSHCDLPVKIQVSLFLYGCSDHRIS
jgi:hypothetical protein